MKVINAEKYIECIEQVYQNLKASGSKGKQFEVEFFAGLLCELAKRIDEDVSATLERLEENPPFSYEGVHEQARQYGKGQFVTHNGSLWHCNRLTRQRPGDGNDWQLAAKGRN